MFLIVWHDRVSHDIIIIIIIENGQIHVQLQALSMEVFCLSLGLDFQIEFMNAMMLIIIAFMWFKCSICTN